jgi:hypothetical protein
MSHSPEYIPLKNSPIQSSAIGAKGQIGLSDLDKKTCELKAAPTTSKAHQDIVQSNRGPPTVISRHHFGFVVCLLCK